MLSLILAFIHVTTVAGWLHVAGVLFSKWWIIITRNIYTICLASFSFSAFLTNLVTCQWAKPGTNGRKATKYGWNAPNLMHLTGNTADPKLSLGVYVWLYKDYQSTWVLEAIVHCKLTFKFEQNPGSIFAKGEVRPRHPVRGTCAPAFAPA